MKLRARWINILTRSESELDFDRIGALAAASALIDLALRAVGRPRSRGGGTLARLLRVFAEDEMAQDWPEEHLLRDAFDARHAAVHEHRVPSQEATPNLVNALYVAWCCLRRRIVTREHAAAIAGMLLRSSHVVDVYMFGSLARNSYFAADIDLLVFDDGEFSSVVTGYDSATDAIGSTAAEYILYNSGMEDDAIRAQTQCGWLDFIALEADRLGRDYNYTRHVSDAQRDPLFFLNIGSSLERFDQESGGWLVGGPPIFRRLSAVRGMLVETGVLSADIPSEPVATPPLWKRRISVIRRRRR